MSDVITVPSHTKKDNPKANAINQTTLGRIEGEILNVQSLLNAINQTTLGRMENEINAINRTTLGRIEGEIKDIQAHVG